MRQDDGATPNAERAPWGSRVSRESRRGPAPSAAPSRRRHRAFALAAILALLLASCRWTGGAPFVPLPSGQADAVWRDLQSHAKSFEGARSYLRVRVTEGGRVRSFNARFFASGDGRVRLEGLTPVGTTAFTMVLDGGDAMWIDEIHATYWEGSIADVAAITRLVGVPLDSRSFTMILLGLPLSDGATADAAGRFVSASGGVVYSVGSSGLAGVDLRSGTSAARVEYLPAAFPPVKLVFSVSGEPGTSLQVEHLDLSSGPQKLSRPEIPRGYALAAPAF